MSSDHHELSDYSSTVYGESKQYVEDMLGIIEELCARTNRVTQDIVANHADDDLILNGGMVIKYIENALHSTAIKVEMLMGTMPKEVRDVDIRVPITYVYLCFVQFAPFMHACEFVRRLDSMEPVQDGIKSIFTEDILQRIEAIEERYSLLMAGILDLPTEGNDNVN